MSIGTNNNSVREWFQVVGSAIAILLAFWQVRRPMIYSFFPLRIEIIGKPTPTPSSKSWLSVPARITKMVDENLSDFYIEILDGKYKGRRIEPVYSESETTEFGQKLTWGKDELGYRMPKTTRELILLFATSGDNLIPISDLNNCQMQIVAKVRMRQGLSIKKLHCHSIKKRFKLLI